MYPLLFSCWRVSRWRGIGGRFLTRGPGAVAARRAAISPRSAERTCVVGIDLGVFECSDSFPLLSVVLHLLLSIGVDFSLGEDISAHAR